MADGMGQVLDAIAEVRSDIKDLLQREAATAARLGALTEQSKAEVAALFEQRDQHAERLRRVELDYVPRHDFARAQKEHEREHDALKVDIAEQEKVIAAMRGQVLRLSIVAGIVIGLISMGVHWFGGAIARQIVTGG